MTRRMTIAEAAQILGVSRKTIERRIKQGQLSATKVDRRTIVDLPDEEAVQTKEDVHETKQRLAVALAELEAVKSERDHLRQQVDHLTMNVSQLTATVYRLTEQKALPAPSKRSWWKFWERDEEPQKEV